MDTLLDCFTEQQDLCDEMDEELRWILAAVVQAVVVPVVAIQARAVQKVPAAVAVVLVVAILIQKNGFS